MIRIIPSLLLYNNTLVKGVKFSNYKNAGNPVTTVLGYQGQKADEIFLINLNHYKQEGEFNLDGLKKYQKYAIHQLPLEVQLIILKKLIKYFYQAQIKYI